MLTIDSKVNMGEAFEKLVKEMKVINKQLRNTKNFDLYNYAYAYGRLITTAKLHIVRCTDQTLAEVQNYMEGNDDIPDELFRQ